MQLVQLARSKQQQFRHPATFGQISQLTGDTDHRHLMGLVE